MMWYHGMCQDMSDKDVANLHKLKDKPGVKWFCSSCTLEIEMTMKGNGDVGMTSAANNGVMNGKLGKIEDMVMKLADALSSNQAKIEDRMQKLEVSYAQAVSSNLDGVKTAQQLNSDAKAQFSQILEHQQAEYRKKNAIIYGVEPEAGRTTMEKIQELMEDVSFPTAAKPLTAKRLQTSQSSVGIKPGPIKLEFSDEGSKWTFLKRANATLRPKNIYCKLDESKALRDQQYRLRQQIKEMKEQDESGTQYRIRNMKIQAKSTGDWEHLPTGRTTISQPSAH